MRAAVLGRPVGHSLSPLLHRAAYAALGLTDWTYDALDLGAEDLPVLLAGLGEEWRGLLGDHAVQAGRRRRRRRRRAAAPAAARGEHAGAAPTTRLAGGEHRRHGVGMALQLAGVERVGSAAIIGAGGTAAAAAVALAVARRPARRRRRPGAGPGRRPAPGARRARRDRDRHAARRGADWTPRWSSAPCPIDAQPALVDLRWRPGRPCSTCSTRPGRRRWPQRVAEAGRHRGRAAWRCCSGRPPCRSS